MVPTVSGGTKVKARGGWSALGAVVAGSTMALMIVPALMGGSPTARSTVVDTEIAGAVEQRGSDLPVAPTASASVLRVSANACGARSHGSGFVVAEGLIVTAAHVVGDAGLVRLDMGSTVATGEVLGRFADGRDIALIGIDTGDGPLPQAGELPGIGGAITMVGYPGDQRRTVSVGLRTDPLPTTADVVTGELLGVAAPTGEGFSGGPALDGSGNLLGVVVAAEVGTGTSIVVRLPNPAALADVELLPNTCPTVS